ncbi:uncharacterized protein EURHEDRAFT_511908 [Aspergillus ruber CBS 135680]|uniref:Uncharacterized protein n=1 Tax=Aspergillus ruber (strain CBS 135680) TaxID=1388766 RepID=A0A017STV3_ASPRC|nr:uncharacterized protein EURHEDRAFT_511908 [Aspergillus ruber CBS 135680]EYE99725.1 hypothetical protein EURHEDRAFT_511908 [Aspergillus ruber CBS 135680]
MTTIFRKIRGKRKLSSELDSRWGDVSISSPNEGSWSQGFQPLGSTVNTQARSPSEQGQRPSSMNSLGRRSSSSHRATKPSPSSAASVDSMPTGHYNANIQSRPRTSHRKSPGTGLGIGMLQNGYSAWVDASSDDMSSDDEGRDGVVRTGRYLTVGTEETDYTRASKSPPLSVTSRMRRNSYQSTIEPSPFIPRTTSLRHASFTSSAPTTSPENSRIGYGHRHPPYPKRNHVRHPNPLELEAARGPELVPSYDELYG